MSTQNSPNLYFYMIVFHQRFQKYQGHLSVKVSTRDYIDVKWNEINLLSIVNAFVINVLHGRYAFE